MGMRPTLQLSQRCSHIFGGKQEFTISKLVGGTDAYTSYAMSMQVDTGAFYQAYFGELILPPFHTKWPYAWARHVIEASGRMLPPMLIFKGAPNGHIVNHEFVMFREGGHSGARKK